MSMKHIVRRSAHVAAVLLAGSASAALADVKYGGPAFDAAKMAASIEATMQPNVVGFSYTIARDGQIAVEKGGGSARIAIDGQRAHGPLQRNNIASVTKTFTAIAVMQLIERLKTKGVTVDTPIAAYLPDGWKPGSGVGQLTFANLLRHRSGFNDSINNGYSTLGFPNVKKVVEAGTTALPRGQTERARLYQNVNFALLRELMPKLWNATGSLKYETIDGSQIWATQGDYHSFLYAKYIGMYVFSPLDIDNVACHDSKPTATLYYPANPDPKVAGIIAVDQSKFCGSGGLYLSTNEMAKTLVYLYKTEKLLPATARQTMMARGFGLNAAATTRGTAYSHDGVVGVSSPLGKGGTKACAINLPGGIVAALVQNSADNAGIAPCSVLINAFEAGWK